MGTILTCKNLQFTYRNSASGMQVGPISFELEEGESFGIVGESGSGKTSLSHLLCRFITPDQLKDCYQMNFVFISHDLALVSQFCQQILVLKDGQVKEMGRTSDCLSAPQNPYTQELLDTYQKQERWLNKCFD